MYGLSIYQSPFSTGPRAHSYSSLTFDGLWPIMLGSPTSLALILGVQLIYLLGNFTQCQLILS